jgi:EpsI family protein
MRSAPPFVAGLMLASALLVSRWPARHPENTPEKPIGGLPLVLSTRWLGRDMPLSARDLELLGLSDYVSRLYTPQDASAGSAPVQLYIGYYSSQRTGATYHSPLNCLPGAGWEITASGYETIPAVAGLRVKSLTIAKEMQRDLVLYWYHDRGRVITNEYAAKAYLIWDAMRLNRTDGALVRIIVPIAGSPEQASAEAAAFLGDLWPELARRLPRPPASARPF